MNQMTESIINGMNGRIYSAAPILAINPNWDRIEWMQRNIKTMPMMNFSFSGMRRNRVSEMMKNIDVNIPILYATLARNIHAGTWNWLMREYALNG